MAPSTGKKKNKTSVCVLTVICVLVLFQSLPYCSSYIVSKSVLKLKMSHTTDLGMTVINKAFHSPECPASHSIHHSEGSKPCPMYIDFTGSLVVNSSLQDCIGDMFVLTPTDTCTQTIQSSVSLPSQIHVEIVQSKDVLHFTRDQYFGYSEPNSPFGTVIKGITDLYACSADSCSNNIEYKIVGSNDFYLQTVLIGGHVNVQIVSKQSLLSSPEHNLIITAIDSHGLSGHTNVHIKITDPVKQQIAIYEKDPTLRFAQSKRNVRHRRATQEQLTPQDVLETSTGELFSVANTSQSWRYALISSTLDNTLVVSSGGQVAVVPGQKLDFEYFTANSIPTTVTLTIGVTESGSDVEIKELVQVINIIDVNDEPPMFTNKPRPYLAAISPNAPGNTLVYRLTATDPDASANLTLTYQGDGGVADSRFLVTITGNVAEIKTRAGAFTLNQQIDVTIKAQDLAAADGVQMTTAVVQVKAGQRIPQFMESTYTFEFEEKNVPDQTITSSPIQVVSFQDRPVTFSLLENGVPSTLFTAVTESGGTNSIRSCNIKVTRPMDYEVDPEVYTVTVQALEAQTGLSSEMEVTIRLTDNNEEAPRFDISTYQLPGVSENIAVNSRLLTVTALDGDKNSKLTFSTNNDNFRADAVDPEGTTDLHTAVIYVNKDLDYDSLPQGVYDFKVYATDSSSIPKTGQATVRIFMKNENDEKPVFPNEMSVNIRYDMDVGKEVTLIQAQDADSGDVVSYTFGNTYPKFSMETTTGRITLAQRIASSQTEITEFQYKLQVIATDNGACCGSSTIQSSTATLTVNILTDNEHRPVFSGCLSYKPAVDEEKADAKVFKVTATDSDYGMNGQVTYSLRDQNSDFRINSTTGDLYTRVAIDREDRSNPTEKKIVNVRATDGGNLEATCSLLVLIKDINDNSPIFVRGTYEENVLQTLVPGGVAVTVEARDDDIGNNSRVTYKLVENPGNYFQITDQFLGSIKVNKTLPAAGQVILLEVEATDMGVPARSTRINVTITSVEDSSLLPPEWDTNGVYDISVKESLPIGSTVLNYTARSRAGSLSSLAYKVVAQSGSNTGSEGDVFVAVDTRLTLRTKMDYETTTEHRYIVTLRATDINNKFTDQQMTIRVIDTNDKIPRFLGIDEENGWLNLNLLEGNYTGLPLPGKLVDTLNAVDEDGTSPNNKIVRYYIDENNSDKNFTINENAELYTDSEFDRETVAIYTLVIKAVDGAPSSILANNGQPNTGRVAVRINIGDVNDNAPSFDNPSYSFNVPEDKQPGFSISKVTANDLDSDAVLRYSISSPNPVPFTVVEQSGDILVFGGLDYENPQTREFNFKVNVNDNLHNASTEVTIIITDTNDNMPVVQDYLLTNYTEGPQSPMGVIFRVSATDADNNGVNQFYFFLQFTNDRDKEYFSIGRRSGDLSVLKQLDRDYPDGSEEFRFTVAVADEDPDTGSPTYGYGQVTIRPKDINDNAPIFLQLQMGVKENEPNVTLVGRVDAVDYDAGDNALFSMIIAQQTNKRNEPVDIFELRPNFDMFTKTTLDRETMDEYKLTIHAVDKGSSNVNTGTGSITIQVLDVNDNAPYFNTSYHFILSEFQTIGEVGRGIKAYDADIGKNAFLTYYLATTDLENFQMDQDSNTNEGILNIFKAVDFDADDLFFNLTVTAEDPDPNHKATTYIEITVTDYNDEAPIFNPKLEIKTILENAAEGTEVAIFTATDRDVNPQYKYFEYFISRKSDPLNQFTIDQSGNVTIKHSLDRETNATHTIHILAIDNVNGRPQNTGTATLTVNVGDINDNFPDFAQPYDNLVLKENVRIDSILVTIRGKDADDSTNGPPFLFALDCNQAGASTQCQSKFSQVFKGDNTGSGNDELVISAQGTFDREFESMITLPIRMCDLRGLTDRQTEQQCGFRYLHVKILDENDNTHEDAYQNILVYNYKGLFGNIDIGTVNTNDLDDPALDQDKTFILQKSDIAGFFIEVGRNTGIIKLLDNVPEMTFEVKVTVTDTDGLSKTTTIKIAVVYITEDAVYNSGSVRIKGITPADFLFKPRLPGSTSTFGDSMYDKFHKQLAIKLYGSDSLEQLDKVQVLSVMPASVEADPEQITDVRFAAHGSPWYQSSRMDGVVSENQADFNKALTNVNNNGKTIQGQIDMVPIDMCQFETCEAGCYNELKVSDTPAIVNTAESSFVGVRTEVVGECGCRARDLSQPLTCSPGYCYHGGVCEVDRWNQVSCDCPEGFDGPRCQQLRQSFNGTGYALYRPLEQCEDSRTSIDILTTQSPGNGLILYNGPTKPLTQTGPKDFIILELKDGYPELRINHGTGEVKITIPGASRKRLNDGGWHTIDIFRNGKYVRLVVDHCIDSTMTNGVVDRSGCEGSGVTPGENIFINTGDVLQLGGRFSTPGYPADVTTAKFNGCMRKLTHNSELYDLSTGGQFKGAVDGCPREDDACGAAGCGNGQCLITGSGATPTAICKCDPGYRTNAGQQCTTVTTVKDLRTESFMDWQLKNTFVALLKSRRNSISFQFRTRDADGVILSMSDSTDSNKYITFKITGGRLQVSYNLGDDAYTISLSSVDANNGNWHTVTLERYGKEFVLHMDGGERHNSVETEGPINGALDFTVKQDQIYSGAYVEYSTGEGRYSSEDFNSSCLNDVRFDNSWFSMQTSEDTLSPAATLQKDVNTVTGCVRNDCINKCLEPFICIPLWESFTCECREHYVKNGDTCLPKDYCADSPCFGNSTVSTCTNNVPPGADELPYKCACLGAWYGPICQCHPELNPGGTACLLVTPPDPVVSSATGMIVGILLGVIVLIVAIVLVACWLMRRPGKEKAELLDDDPDDIRENIMYYDEEGAGEEDQTRYDLSRLRKPDDGEHPTTWDAPDIKRSTKQTGSSAERPDIGDFISGRLDDADDDQGPQDTPIDFDYEGGGSEAGSLSSLNTSSSGSQDYDYLNEWGPKFAKLADMYNNYDDE